MAIDQSTFDPSSFPHLLSVEGDRIYYLGTAHGARAKNYSLADPEERVRAWFYCCLVEDLKYPVERIDVEVEVYRRKPEDFADIVVYEDDQLTKPYFVIECKEPKISAAEREQALKQAWGNANNLGATYAGAVLGEKVFFFDPKTFTLKSREKHWTHPPERYGKPIKFKYVRGSDSFDLRPTTLDALRSAFQACHDILWEGGKRNPAQAFDEMTKLMFSKLRDETTWTADDEPYGFQIGSNETPSEVAGRVRTIFDASKAAAQSVFRSSILVDNEAIYRVVDALQDISLHKTDLDAKGKAFEKFLGSVFRGDMGQYFTPRTVVRFVVDVLRPSPTDRVLDPACGSGGFLLYSLEHVQRAAEVRFRKDETARRNYWRDWAFRGLYGVEVNDQISRVAMMGMILHEDGHTNIAFADGLESFEDLQRVNVELKEESFSVVMANPPFGSNIKRSSPKARHKYLDDFDFGKGRPSQRKEVLFLERCLDFLAPGGRMGIVLPESIFNAPTMEPVRQYVEERAFLDAVVSLPVETFVSSGANVKSSVMFVRKYTKEEAKRVSREREIATTAVYKRRDQERKAILAQKKNASAAAKFESEVAEEVRSIVRNHLAYEVFFAKADSVGIGATGQPTPDELPEIALKYHDFRKTNSLKLGAKK